MPGSESTSKGRTTLGRIGYAARGIVYGLVGAIALAVAFGEEKSSADQSGALASIADSGVGRVGLVLITIGLAAYALYCLSEVVFGTADGKDGKEEKAERLASIARTVIYAALAVTSGRLAAGAGGGSSGAKQQTSTVFDLPAGELLVLAAGVVLIGVALQQVYEGFSRGFMDDLDESRMDEHQRQLARTTGTAGHIARALVYGVIGGFLIKATLEHDAQEAKGIDGALQELAQQPLGGPLLALVAVGFIVLGVYSTAIEARFRRL